MGNWNSNRWTTYRKRRTADECMMISVSFFGGEGLDDKYVNSGRLELRRKTWDHSLSFTVEPDYLGGLVLDLDFLQGPKGVQVMGQRVSMHSTAIFRSRRRWWFECPIEVGSDGEFPIKCLNRCAVLYLPPDGEKFGCRKCHRLAYRSSQTHDKRRMQVRKPPVNNMILDSDPIDCAYAKA